MSFCSPNAESYESRNGILSQWRGYAANDGCCIIFDTRALAEILLRELQRKFYITIKIRPVVYSDGLDISRQFPTLFESTCEYILAHLERRDIGDAVKGMEQLLDAATIVKHHAFREEKEVRIVAMVGGKALLDEYRQMTPGFDFGTPKQVLHNTSKNRRYIQIPDRADTPLPVVGVFVGPSPNQERSFERAKAVVANRCEVWKSQIPLVVR